MSTNANQKRRFWSWGTGEGKTGSRFKMRSAVATMQEEEAALDAIVLAEGLGYEVKLIHVLPGTSPDFRTECAADILCLNLHDFGLSETIAWVRAAVEFSPDSPPCIAVLGSEEVLDREELWRISTELEPSGAIFHSWPKECESFDEAFKVLGDGISKSYGRPIIRGAKAIAKGPNCGVLVNMNKA